MKSPYVSELQPNQVVTATFLVQHKDIRQKRTGEPYLSLVLCDRTGDVEAKMWDNVAEVMDTFERDDFLKVRGLLQVYQNRLQFTVHRLQKQSETDIDFTDFFPASKRNPQEMFDELLALVNDIRTEYLRHLLLGILSDPDIARRYRTAPAAKNIHHAYLGGLLEHVLSLCTLARLTAAHYSNIDADLLLTGVILHDIGKIFELTYDRSFGYSSDGQLLGHIIIALRLVGDHVNRVDGFPPKVRTLIEHMIVSHHGELEFGSPKVPVFPEALLLHHLDNLDSKMECMRAFLEKDRHVDGCWTTYCPPLERSVLKKSKYLEDQPPASSAEAAPGAPQNCAPARVPAPNNSAPAAPSAPARTLVPPAPPPRPAPAKTGSLFGEKLAGALGFTKEDA